MPTWKERLNEDFKLGLVPTETNGYNATKEEIIKIDVAKELAEFPLEPYPGRIYVMEDEIVKSHGLFVPETSRKDGEMQTNRGIVIAVGADVGFVAPGDKVFYGQFSGAWVMNRKYRIMNEKDLLGRYK